MKIDVTRPLAEEILEQLAAIRDGQREKHGNTVEWDRSGLGQLYSMLRIELDKRSRASTSKESALSNRRKAQSRFSR